MTNDEKELCKGHFCELCRVPATRCAYDAVEVQPDDDGWIKLMLGNIHFGCDIHEPPAREIPVGEPYIIQ